MTFPGYSAELTGGRLELRSPDGELVAAVWAGSPDRSERKWWWRALRDSTLSAVCGPAISAKAAITCAITAYEEQRAEDFFYARSPGIER